VCNSAIYEKFVMNYYDPLSSNIANTSSQVEWKQKSEEKEAESEQTEKSLFPLETNGNKETRSENSINSNISLAHTQLEWKQKSEKSDGDSKQTEKSLFPLETNGNYDTSLRETNFVKLIMIKEPPNRKIIGVDGKEYEIPDLNVEFELPEANAELFLTHGYAMRVPYKCECGKAFPDKASLTKHQANCEEFQRRQNEEALDRLKARGWV